MKLYKIPASVTMAQGILESGYGESTLANELEEKGYEWLTKKK